MESYDQPINLRQTMKQNGLGLRTLSNRTNISIDTLKMYTSGEAVPSIDDLIIIADAIARGPETRDNNNRNYGQIVGYRGSLGLLSTAEALELQRIHEKTEARLGPALRVLPPLEREVFSRLYGLEEYTLPQTPNEVVRAYPHMTVADVIRIDRIAKTRVRHFFQH